MIKHLTCILLAFLFLGCVQQTQPKTITFKLKLEDTEDVKSVGLRGNLAPLSWDQNIPLTYSDMDGTYETKIQMNTANFALQFKFVVNDSIFELKQMDNRQIQFKYQPETIVYNAVYNSPEPTEVYRK